MATIATAGNSSTACLQALQDKGYVVSYAEPGFVAKKDNESFAAENFIELLGLVALWEMWGKDWQEKGCGRDAWEKLEESIK